MKVGVNVFALANTPPPSELQVKLVSFVTLATPAKKIKSSPSHIVFSTTGVAGSPIVTTGCGAMVTITSSVTGVAQGAIGKAVKRRVAVPLAMSAGPGIKVGVRLVSFTI